MFKTRPCLLQVFRRMLQNCFAVRHEKCFVDYKTSHEFPSARVDNESIFILW